MAEIKISAKARTEFGKGAARRARRDGLVPAVLYGHGTDPVHVSLPGHETLLALRAANALLSISIDGTADQLARAQTSLSGITRLERPGIAPLSVALRTLRSVIRSGSSD